MAGPNEFRPGSELFTGGGKYTRTNSLTGAGMFNAAAGGLGLLGDVAGLFQKNAQADATDRWNKQAYKNDLAIWHAKNAESMRANDYQIKSWAFKNNNIIAGYNARTEAWKQQAEVYHLNIKNVDNKVAQDYFNDGVNLRRLYGDVDLNQFEEQKEFLRKLGTTNNEQVGVSVDRQEMMDENDMTVGQENQGNRMKDQAVENYQALGAQRQLEATNTKNNMWARLGLPPTKPQLLPEPPMISNSMASPMRAPRAQRAGWGDVLKIGMNAATTAASFMGSPGNFMYRQA